MVLNKELIIKLNDKAYRNCIIFFWKYLNTWLSDKELFLLLHTAYVCSI